MLSAGQPENVRVPCLRAAPLQPVGGTLKRALDIVLALTALVLLMPLIVLVALLVATNVGRPVLCRYTRIGFGGRPFGCHVFRTTPNGVPYARPTPFGELLQRSGIEKLPLLLNVLKGEMSLVGPRPLLADELLRQGNDAEPYLMARPGVTGTWQLGPDLPSRAEEAALGSAYVRNWSVQGDIGILVRSIPAIVRAERTL
jgi:exopolysaccharide production protein ExoY